MSLDKQYKQSLGLWKLEQENLISILKLNKEYLEKEIELKKRALSLVLETIEHEENMLFKINIESDEV